MASPAVGSSEHSVWTQIRDTLFTYPGSGIVWLDIDKACVCTHVKAEALGALSCRSWQWVSPMKGQDRGATYTCIFCCFSWLVRVLQIVYFLLPVCSFPKIFIRFYQGFLCLNDKSTDELSSSFHTNNLVTISLSTKSSVLFSLLSRL